LVLLGGLDAHFYAQMIVSIESYEFGEILN
jgi:hypothetical protein